MTTVKITYAGQEVNVKFAPGIRFSHFRTHNNLVAEDMDEQANEMFIRAQTQFALDEMESLKNESPYKATQKVAWKNGIFVAQTQLHYETSADSVKHAELVKAWAKKKLQESAKAQERAKSFLVMGKPVVTA